MGSALEALQGRSQGLRSSLLRRPLILRSGGFRLEVDPDGSVQTFDSLEERRALFGHDRPLFFKVQAGIVVQAQKPDWTIRVAPRSSTMGGRVFGGVEVIQSLSFLHGGSPGYTRRVKMKNLASTPIRLRILDVFDPTTARLGRPTTPRWGALGVNAFNRVSHVAMDEVSDPPSARVIGAVPQPSKFYMTTDVERAADLLNAGELPDATAGMSGQVLVISQHDFELQAGETKELLFASLYNPKALEEALSDFRSLDGVEKPSVPRTPLFSCSSPLLTEATSWAASTLESARFTADPLDRYDSGEGLAYVSPDDAASILRSARSVVRKDGGLPHSSDPGEAGVLETAVFLKFSSALLLQARDKKLSRPVYPLLRRCANFLMAASKDNSVKVEAGRPQGWRRRLGSGYPTGEVPEVSLAVAAALLFFSRVARQVSKSEDAGKFRERSEMTSERVRQKLLDERGYLSLCLDASGRARQDETIDMAVSAFRHPFHPSAEQAAVHRLLEKDFETPYGPRTIPTTNKVYFNPSYGDGQLGGYWTRAALSLALLCYRTGLPGVGNLQLQKVARLVVEDSVRLGGSPGQFPRWVDVEAGEAHGEDSDPVAASRFVQGLLEGEMGLSLSQDRPTLAPPGSSGLDWAMASGLWAGEQTTIFVGRSGGRPHVFVGGGNFDSRDLNSFAKSEPLSLPAKGCYGASFQGPGQVICLGSCAGAPSKLLVAFAPRAPELAKRLSTPLEAYDLAKGTWNKVGSLRVLPSMSFEATLAPGEWKAFRVPTP